MEFYNNQWKVTPPLRVRKLHNICKHFHPGPWTLTIKEEQQPPASDLNPEYEVCYSPVRPFRWGNEDTDDEFEDVQGQPDPGLQPLVLPNQATEAESATAVRTSNTEESSSTVRPSSASIHGGPSVIPNVQPDAAAGGPADPLGAFAAGPTVDATTHSPRSPQHPPATRPAMGKDSSGKGKRKPGVRLSPPHPKRPHVTLRLTPREPRPASTGPPGYKLLAPSLQGHPIYHFDSRPPGYKIWVGDLPQDTSGPAIWNRIWDTLERAGQKEVWWNITQLVVKPATAASGSSYAVITVSDVVSARDPQLTL